MISPFDGARWGGGKGGYRRQSRKREMEITDYSMTPDRAAHNVEEKATTWKENQPFSKPHTRISKILYKGKDLALETVKDLREEAPKVMKELKTHLAIERS